jgi:hypothetical protein
MSDFSHRPHPDQLVAEAAERRLVRDRLIQTEPQKDLGRH